MKKGCLGIPFLWALFQQWPADSAAKSISQTSACVGAPAQDLYTSVRCAVRQESTTDAVRTANPTWLAPLGFKATPKKPCLLIVPTSRRRTVRVGMQPETLHVSLQRTQSVPGGVTTQSVGTIDIPVGANLFAKLAAQSRINSRLHSSTNQGIHSQKKPAKVAGLRSLFDMRKEGKNNLRRIRAPVLPTQQALPALQRPQAHHWPAPGAGCLRPAHCTIWRPPAWPRRCRSGWSEHGLRT